MKSIVKSYKENTGGHGYNRAKQKRIENWSNLRQQLIEAAVQKECPTSDVCTRCESNTSNLFRCIDCASWLHMCMDCLQASHSLPHLHIFEKWMKDTYLAVDMETPVWRSTHITCNTRHSRQLIIIDDKGRQHLREIEFCSCEPDAVTLLRMDLWAASPKQPRMAFHIDLLKWLNGLLLHSHVSVKSFIDSLNARISKRQRLYVYGQGQDVYQILMKECIEEFRHFTYLLENGQHITEKLDKGTSCPACFLTSTKIFSFDADFQLVRKFSAGQSWTSPRHKGNFFFDQTSVDTFVSSYNCSIKLINEIGLFCFPLGEIG